MKKLIIFDLDGTLLDTVGDLAACCNEVLANNSIPEHPTEAYYSFVGRGITHLITCALPASMRTEQQIATMQAEFVKIYNQKLAVHTKPYNGVEQMLTALANREDTVIAIASNKYQAGTEALVKRYFGKYNFLSVTGNRPNIPLKPNPYVLREILQVGSYTPDKAIFVGDTEIDMQTAAAAGIDSVGVSWGFRGREVLEACNPQYIIDRPEELLALIQNPSI